MQNQQEFEIQRRIAQQEKNLLITRTPVCAGIMKLSAPPETPSLYENNRFCRIKPTPVIKAFNVLKPAESD